MRFGFLSFSPPAIAACFLILFLSPGTKGQTGQNPRGHAATEVIEAWPVTDIKQWVGYEDIPTINPAGTTAPSGKSGDEPRQPLQPDPEQQAERQTRLRLQWQRARPEALRILKAIRADLVKELASMRPDDEQSTRHELIVAGRDPTRPPYVKMNFAVDGRKLRPTHLHIYAPAAGTEPPIHRRSTWRRFAEKTFEQIFGQEPAGRPDYANSRISMYINWKVHWQNRPLPPGYWLQFGAVKYGNHWVHAWTARYTPDQGAAAQKALDGYPIGVGHRQAVMTAVKSAFNLIPEMIDDHAKVWARFELIQPETRSGRWSRTHYLDRPALEKSSAQGPLLAIWRVRIVPYPKGEPFLVAWVDPVEGRFLRLNIEAVRTNDPLAR